MNPVKTLCFTFSLVALLAASAAAQTVYFYPPDDAKWIAGRSYITQGSESTAELLQIDPTRCGWYTANVPSSSNLRKYAQFWLGSKGVDRIGPNGRWSTDFEPTDNFSQVGGVFNLGDLFTKYGNNIYLVADELDPTNPNSGWYGSDPGISDKTRCEFKLAAFIYDTDPSVHPDFSCASWNKNASEGNGEAKAACDEPPNAANKKGECIGVIKGLAKKDLNKDTRKIECDNCTKKSCWSSKKDFEDMFKSTPKVNVERCYNMPFTQVKTGSNAGSFEFDSDKLRQDGTTSGSSRLVGGFFPDILNTDAGLADGDYSQCSACKTKRTADRFNIIDSSKGGWESWTTRAQYDTLVSRFYEYQSKEGDFATADKPNKGDIWAAGYTCSQEAAECALYDWTCRRTASCSNTNIGAGYKWYLYGNEAIVNTYGNTETTFKSNSKANQHFCFESHADFVYDPSQVFYFSGDDPIWVYINYKLVIDLGGAHLASPAHVDLKSLGLTAGETYPIDIFFCDQRTVNSNVRISTNMYVVQKSNFWSNNTGTRDQPMCAEISGGSDCASKMGMGNNGSGGAKCGQALIDDKSGYKVQFYMIARGTKDTIWLDPTKNSKNCTGSANNWSCYRGIKGVNAVYSCGDKNQCKGNDKAAEKVEIVGNYNVYARLVDSKGAMLGKPLLIDNIRSASNTRIIWGSATPWPSETNANPQAKELKDAYGTKTTKEQNIIAGRRTPIYISSGSWDDAPNYTSFSYDDDAANTAGFSVTISGNTGLKIYETETGGTGATGYSGNLVNGMATLWVEGGYDIGNKTFKLNVTSEADDSPSLTINVYQPELRFVESNGTTAINNPDGWTRWATTSGNPPTSQPPFVGQSLDKINLVAWDAKRNEICKTCDFSLKQTSSCGPSCNKQSVVTSNATKITAGIASANFYLSGTDEVLGSNRAELEFLGPSKEQTHAKWTGLQFRTSPVPTPNKSIIFDRNGDGKGDSLVIEFNRSFRKDTNNVNSDLNDSALIVLLEVAWEKGKEPIHFHPPQYSVSQLKSKAEVLRLYKTREFFENNRNYWRDKIKGGNLVVVTAPAFSEEIQTIGTSESVVSSYTPFYERDLCIASSCGDNAFNYDENGSKRDIQDGIPPVVVKAEYTYVSSNAGNCLENGPGCKEQFIVYLSEPVFAGPDATGNEDARKNPFKYCFGRSLGTNCPVSDITPENRLSQDYNNSDWAWEIPTDQIRDFSNLAIYKPSNTKNSNSMTEYTDGINPSSGDTIVDMVYYSKKLSADATTHTPKSDDWVKLRTDYKIYQDAAGNFANPRERGVIITGINPARKKQIKIAQVVADPKAPVLGGTFTGDRKGEEYYPNWISDATMDWANKNLFQPGNVAEFLPIPKHITNPDTIKAYYPGSVGTLFDISDRIGQDVKKFVQEECMPTAKDPNQRCVINGKDLTEYNIDELAPEAISIHASAFYHTNLGDYTAHRNNLQLDCTSELFRNEANVGNCISNNYNFYLAWDLKTNAGRFVGAGAYVAVAKFYWELKYMDEKGNKKTSKFGKDEAIEMFGVRRVPK